ncbi:MAG: Ig-like domain-containing protein [Clostridiales bacterium]|nr:Ig-like domain-containing protein [Clostridiales bacterium]
MQKVTYTSSNKKMVTVTAKGVVTAKKAGAAKITVRSGTKKVVVTVKVTKK